MEVVEFTPSEGQSQPYVKSNHRLKTDAAWKYISEAEDEAGKKLFVCTFCQKGFRGGGINRMKQHLAGVKGNVASCLKVPEDVKRLVQGILEEKTQKTKEVPSGFVVPTLNAGEEVEVQTINPQIIKLKKGKEKASSKLQSDSKRVVEGDGDGDEALVHEIKVSKFDYSVDNYLKVVDKIAMLSGESEVEYEQTEIPRLSSSVTFLSKWRDFIYQPRVIRFACEKTNFQKDVTSQINLPQYSSAAVPKDTSPENKTLSPLSKDFVMNVGGPVWALDWCPRIHPSSTFDTNVEFIAVSAHPPESSYHQIGAPLTGRGLVQIWCMLNTDQSQQDEIPLVKVKSRKSFTNIDPTEPKRPRGRPRKTPKMDSSDQVMHDLSVECPESSNNVLMLDSKEEFVKKVKSGKPRGRPRKNTVKEGGPEKTPVNEMDSSDQVMHDLSLQSPESSNNLLQSVSKEEIDKKAKSCKPRAKSSKKLMKEPSNTVDSSNKDMQSLAEFTNNSPNTSPEPLAVAFPNNSRELVAIDKFTVLTPEILAKEQVTEKVSEVYTQKPKDQHKDHSAKSMRTTSKSKSAKCQTKGADSPNSSQHCESPLDQDDALPRLVMGLAHNGKVAWDVKWRPSGSGPGSKHIMGHLAVLLGNGALEVWEVPLPHVIKAIFYSCQKEGNDPRFLKLKPVFFCSMLKCGDRQSIPLTLEWSASAPHDLILAGCHDGVVALWKFSASSSSKDTRPLLCFSADTVPIRALKWAPLASDPESANTIVTAGHKGLKFWDIRDPFHPLWDIPSQKIINSLDWLPDPRCVVLSCDDGEIKIISLLKAACDVPVTGMPSAKKPQHGSYSYYCSSSSIWSVQVSRLTGMVAYCCADGKVISFQLTTKAVEKDPHRNREPHYLCGSIMEEDSSLTVFSPLPTIPIPMKNSSTEWVYTPKTSRGVKSRSNQERRAKDEISKCQTPPKQSSGTFATPRKNNDTTPETQTQAGQASVSPDTDNKIEEEDVKDEEIEVFPPKIVAMHRATWNTNKGGERLVCYGGAAGIVRCQEIKKFKTIVSACPIRAYKTEHGIPPASPPLSCPSDNPGDLN